MTYNTTLLQGKEGITGMIQFANYATGDMFIGIVVISIYIILLLALKKFDFVQALISSSFVMFMISIFLTYAGVLNILFPIMFLSITAFASLYLYTAGY